MLITIPDVLSADEVAEARTALDAAEWVDGKVTAGYQAQSVKENLQLPEGHPVAVKLGEMVLAALARSPLFMSAARAEDTSGPMWTPRFARLLPPGNGFARTFQPLCFCPRRINMTGANCWWRIPTACRA